MTQRRTTPRRRKFLAVPLFLACATASACEAKELKFTTPDTVGNESTATTIADLTEDQASQLCVWIVATYPNPNSNTVSNTDEGMLGIPGYVSTGGFGFNCEGRNMFLGSLTQDNCVLNLRHSPCHATVDDLKQCLQDAHDVILASVASLSGNLACSDAGKASCIAFEAAASCDETIFQAALSHQALNGGDELLCLGLPVQPGVTCPPTLGEPLEDGGTYALP